MKEILRICNEWKKKYKLTYVEINKKLWNLLKKNL
jgi:hypothetical protein